LKLWEAISSPANFPNYDSRNDLGLGKTQSHFFFHRHGHDEFPYGPESEKNDDDETEEEEDLAFSAKVKNKIGSNTFSDPMSIRSVDNQYHTPNASSRFDMAKLGEAVGGMRSSRGSMSPMPNMYKGKEAVLGGAHSWNASHKDIQHTMGTKRGYAGGHKIMRDEISSWEDEKNDADDPVSKIRRIVKAYHDLNLLAR
jgi:hypothetical protein